MRSSRESLCFPARASAWFPEKNHAAGQPEARDATKVPVDITLELAAGHEVAILPMITDWHNATATTIEDVAIEALP